MADESAPKRTLSDIRPPASARPAAPAPAPASSPEPTPAAPVESTPAVAAQAQPTPVKATTAPAKTSDSRKKLWNRVFIAAVILILVVAVIVAWHFVFANS